MKKFDWESIGKLARLEVVDHGLNRTEDGMAELETIEKWTRTIENGAREIIRETGAEHAVYGVEFYRNGNLDRVRLYQSPVLMTGAEYEERTRAQMKAAPGCRILAVHAA